MLFPGGASPTTALSTHKELKETPVATETCPFCKCRRKCNRRQELERHVCQHLPHFLYCAQPDCDWTGNRRYALQDHLKKEHLGITIPEQDGYIIYDAKGLVKQLLNKEITLERADWEARRSYQSRAVQLGKLGIWRE